MRVSELIMSWLYTIVFAGLVFSAGESVSGPELLPLGADVPAAEERVVQDETERFEQSYPLNANGRVSLSNVNGSIVVEAWDRNEVRLQYVKSADSRERLAEVEVRIDARPDRFHVEADHNSPRRSNNGWNSGRLKVEFHLMVPRGAVLNEIEAVNGSVTVSNFTNITRISAVNGSVKATNLRGTANLSTVNGEVHADFDRLDAGTKISLDTVNGRVNLLLPSDANATIKADSLNGNITNDLGLPVQKGKYVGRDVYGRVGSGDVQIRMDSVNGTIHFSRKNDGRSPNPVVNLLPQKEKDEDNWNWNHDLQSKNGKIDKNIDTTKANKEIEKAVKESQKLSAKAAKDAAAAISKIQPPIAEMTAESIAQTVEAITRSAELLDARELQKEIQKAQVDQNSLLGRITQVGFLPAMPRVEKKSGSFSVKGTPKVTVQARGCSVKVRGWDRQEVQYRVVQFGDQRDPGPIKFTESHSDTSVDIVVENPRLNTRLPLNTSNFRVEISVPRRSNMKITADGELRVEGVTGEIELVGTDEPINVRDAGGKLKVTNSDGLIRVIGFSGDLEAQTTDGMVSLEGDFKTLRARGTEGSVSLTLPDGSSADVESNNPDISSEGVELRKMSSSAERTRYRIGTGGRPYTIETDGAINIRSSASLTAKE